MILVYNMYIYHVFNVRFMYGVLSKKILYVLTTIIEIRIKHAAHFLISFAHHIIEYAEIF